MTRFRHPSQARRRFAEGAAVSWEDTRARREAVSWRPHVELEDADWLRGLEKSDVAEWALYELLNRRCNAVYDLEQDEEFFAVRSLGIRSGYRN